MKVKDLMEPLKNWLTAEMSLREAIKVFKSTKRGHGLPVNALVVLDNEMNLVGIVSTKDILRLLIPPHVYMDDPQTQISWTAVQSDKKVEIETTTVSQIMTEDVRVIDAEESIFRCADSLLSQQLRRLPVTRSDGKVAGVIYLRDVYNGLTEMIV